MGKQQECLGVKPLCPNGQSPKCVNGEWVCQGVAIDDPIEEIDNVVKQSTSDIDGSKGTNGND